MDSYTKVLMSLTVVLQSYVLGFFCRTLCKYKDTYVSV